MNASRLLVCGILLAGAFIVVRPLLPADSTARRNRAAAIALSREEWSDALRSAQQALDDDADNPDALAIAGIASARLHQNDASLTYLTDIDPADLAKRPQLHAAVLVEQGRRFRRLGRLIDAERCFHDALAIDGRLLDAHRQLKHILGFQGRCAEAAPHLLGQLRANKFRADELYMLGIPNRIVLSDERMSEQCRANDPDDPIWRLGPARTLVADHRLAEAEPIVRRIIQYHPHLPLAHALLGQILLEQNRVKEFIAWQKSLPDDVSDAPEVWFIRSLWARQTHQYAAAVRCLLETLDSYPNHVEANYQLSQLFQKLDEVERAEFFSQRSLLLSRLAYVINDLRGNPDLHLMREAVDAFEKLGRGWEVVAWCSLAEEYTDADWAIPKLKHWGPIVSREPGLVIAGYHPLAHIRPDEYPLPEWHLDPTTTNPAASQSTAAARFTDAAAASGLDFQYFNSMNPDVGLEHIFQTTGGGVAVLDFDLDLWPDLYFGNGRVLPDSVNQVNDAQSVHLDALYRNLQGEHFAPVTASAALGDDRFSQGVTSGDFDNDGFPDIYVGNVGGNRLYLNNGDGTFTEATDPSQTSGNQWTMSAMIADIDGDGLSDLYAVNYLDMAEVFARSCKKDGAPLTCAPTLFTAEQDRLYLNQGDGTCADVTEQFGLTHPNGKGLGIVGLKVEGRPALQLFVANDTTENLFYETAPSETEPGSRYHENAVLAGLAMSEAGNMQACMGVAAGDVDADGSIDLFVTNFFADSNTMYLQTVPGIFTDATRQSALAEPSYGMVGFGTQFLDAELDGDLDLIITNGHVDQTFATGEPDRMPPQFFLNTGDGTFAQPDALPGPFFEEQRFGRALARLDWNRDAKDDACIVHLDAPVALLTNETPTDNQALVVHLRGTTSSRDAIGTVVTLTTDTRTYSRQLTGGDGYQASNEKKLTFGLPAGQSPQSLHVAWPDGTDMTFKAVASDELVIVQGRGAWSTRTAQ